MPLFREPFWLELFLCGNHNKFSIQLSNNSKSISLKKFRLQENGLYAEMIKNVRLKFPRNDAREEMLWVKRYQSVCERCEKFLTDHTLTFT